MKSRKNIEYIKSQLLQYKWRIVELLLLSFFIGLFSLTVPIFMQFFTDEIIIGQKWELLLRTIVVFAVIIILRYLIDFFYEVELSKVVYGKLIKKQRYDLAYKMLYLDTKYLFKDNNKLAEKDLESVIVGDTDAFRNILSQTIKFLTELFKLLILFIILFYYSIPVGILSCIRIPIFFVVIRLFGVPLDKFNESARSSKSVLIQRIKSIFLSIVPIKSMCLESSVLEKIGVDINNYTGDQEKIAITNANYQEINTAINTFFSIFSIIICGYSIFKGNMSIGEMMLVNNIQSRTTMPLFFFNNFYLQYKNCFPSVTRLVNITEIEVESSNKYLKKQTELSFSDVRLEHICYSYDDKKNILDDVSLVIKKGEKIIISGDNMSGKSTLIKIIAGLIKPDFGKIFINGLEINNTMELRDYFTVLLQNQNDYCYFGTNGSGGEVSLKNLKLVKDNNKKILLLDEPDASLNKDRLYEVEDVFNNAETSIMISHRHMEECLKDSREIRLEKGKVIEKEGQMIINA